MLPTASSSAPFKPKMNEPETYHDVRFGVGETQSNVASVTCGGWDPDSVVRIEYDPDINPPASLQINCIDGLNACNGTTGFANLKEEDGTVNLCMSKADPAGNGAEYLLIHELVHALQIAPLEPGEPIPGGCCNLETEAYLAMCSAMEADGIFDTNEMIAADMDVQTCVQYGVTQVSCAGISPPCYNTTFTPLQGQAYIAAATSRFTGTCEDLKNNPTPRVQQLIDEFEEIANSMQHLYTLKCDDGSQDCVPVPDISPDLPGRENAEPIGDSKTGIGLRGSYMFPDTTEGYMSACNIYDTKYFDQDLFDRGIAYGLEDDDEDRDPNTGKPLTNPGDVEVNQEGLCIRYANATPHQCEKLYERFRTLSDGAPRPVMSCHTKDTDEGDVDGDGDDDGDDDIHYAFNFVKTYCFDYNDEGTRPPIILDFLQVTTLIGIESMVPTPWMPPELSKKCFGQECRTPFLPEFLDKFPENCDYDDTTGQMYHSHTQMARISSYYRHYSGPLLYNLGVTITEVKHGENIREWKVRGECYEYYDVDQGGSWNGEDWKPRVSTLFDEKCELIIGTKDCGDEGDCTETDPHQQEPLKPRWKMGPHIDGNQNMQKESYMPEVDIGEPERGGRTAPDAWLYDDESVLTMLDNERVQEVQRLFEDPSDPSGFLDAMLESKVRGGKTVPDDARTDGFDDTDDREFTIWWEKQQKELLKLIRDPTIKLIMPPRVLTGLASDDPLIELASGMVSQPDGTVAITLRAGPEELGAVTRSFQQMYVAPIREVRIPILSILASKSELKTRRAEWELWKLRNPSIAGQADPLIDKIDEYLEDLERVRLMRLALAGRLQKMYETQEDIREFYGEWYEGNSQLILDAAQASIERQRLKTIWRKLQKAWLQADACQILWCSNHRYSAPVYTLLDNWWRQKSLDGPVMERDRDALPEPPDLTGLAPDTPDKSYDFSFMGLSQEEWRVPVLWPVSVRVQIPLPPTYKGSEPLGEDEYPELPDYPDKTVFDGIPVPVPTFPDQTFIDSVPLPDLTEAKKRLMLMREMIEGITVTEQIYEEEMEQQGNSSAESGTDSFPTFRDSMRGAYCRLDPSVLMPPSKEEDIAIDEDYGNAIKIIHTETDLMERAGRIWSRWMPQRKEDYAGRMIRVGEQFPDPNDPPPCKEDVVCIPMPDEIFKSWKWQWFLPPLDGDFRAVADQMRDLTLPDSEDENPFIDADVELLKRLFPKIDLPIDIELEPDPPAAP